MKKNKIIILLIILQQFIPALLSANDESPLWPLRIDISQSSSFAEFRGMRFHAGIDLRTQRRCGIPVRAIEDGYISRASIQFRGYGYGLYIDHPKLNARVVYGHLEDFYDPLKSYCEKKLAKMGKRHGINEFFKPWQFSVKKGQVVAYSGESGSGPPHLHFEIRSFKDEPIAPAVFGYRPDDKIFPTFHHLYIEPAKFGTKINNSFNACSVKLKKLNKTTYVWDKAISIDGTAKLKIGVMDSNGAGNFYGVEKIDLFLNGEKIFNRLFHKYSYSENNQCPLVYDYFKSNMRGTGYVVNLFKEKKETLSFSSGYAEKSGYLSIADKGVHEVKIVATDFGGNEIIAKGPFKMSSAAIEGADSKIATIDALNLKNVYPFAHTDVGLLLKSKISMASPEVFKSNVIRCFGPEKKEVDLPFTCNGDEAEILIPYAKLYEKGLMFGENSLLNDWTFIGAKRAELKSAESFCVKFSQDSLINNGYFKLIKTIKKPIPGGSKKKGFLRPYSSAYAILPKEKVFFQAIKIGLKPENYKGKSLKKLGIYSVAKNGRYSHLGEDIHDGKLWISSKTTGEFVVLEDSVSPKVWYSSQQTIKHFGPCWVFKATDLGEGVNFLASKASYNGVACETYADPDKSSVYVVKPPRRKKNGKLVLTVHDYAGNSKAISRKF